MRECISIHIGQAGIQTGEIFEIATFSQQFATLSANVSAVCSINLWSNSAYISGLGDDTPLMFAEVPIAQNARGYQTKPPRARPAAQPLHGRARRSSGLRDFSACIHTPLGLSSAPLGACS